MLVFSRYFIDGTVAGNPADLTIYIDSSNAHDHTYYGRGCKNGWGTSGEGGSQTPCADSDAGGRYVTTADNETQKNGTYYHYQAASVGAGGAMTTDNTVTPDTFCPLGWQLPYSGTGGDYYDKSKSWNKLFTSYSIGFDSYESAANATKVKSYPLSYVYAGGYYWSEGRLYYQNDTGFYWASTIRVSSVAYLLNTWRQGIRPSNAHNKTDGLVLRCN